ncbi:hypothetical protein [Streptomyces sp. NPDC057413]
MTRHDELPAPRNAYEAAHQLADAGEHVHLVSEGESICISGECQ